MFLHVVARGRFKKKTKKLMEFSIKGLGGCVRKLTFSIEDFFMTANDPKMNLNTTYLGGKINCPLRLGSLVMDP